MSQFYVVIPRDRGSLDENDDPIPYIETDRGAIARILDEAVQPPWRVLWIEYDAGKNPTLHAVTLGSRSPSAAGSTVEDVEVVADTIIQGTGEVRS